MPQALVDQDDVCDGVGAGLHDLTDGVLERAEPQALGFAVSPPLT